MLCVCVARKQKSKKDRLSKRRLKTPQQLEILENEYAITRFPNTAKRQAISAATGLTPRGVQIWFVGLDLSLPLFVLGVMALTRHPIHHRFQNKRAKDKFFESSAQKYMAKREGAFSISSGGTAGTHYQALRPTPVIVAAAADAHFPMGPAAALPPRAMSLPLPLPEFPPFHQQQQQSPNLNLTHHQQQRPPTLPPIASFSPPPRPRSASPSASSSLPSPMLPPISSLVHTFSPLHTDRSGLLLEPGTTTSSRSSSPLSSCPFNLINVPPNLLSSSPSVSRSASPVHQPGGGGGGGPSSSSSLDLNTLISSLNNTINFLTALHSITPSSSRASSPVCAWQGEVTWQGFVPVSHHNGDHHPDAVSSGNNHSALPQLYSCLVSIPLVCLATDRNCVSYVVPHHNRHRHRPCS
jgi:hypothetical protein